MTRTGCFALREAFRDWVLYCLKHYATLNLTCSRNRLSRPCLLCAFCPCLHTDQAFDDYLEMVIQFGYITMFAAAFPSAAAISVIYNVGCCRRFSCDTQSAAVCFSRAALLHAILPVQTRELVVLSRLLMRKRSSS